MNLKMLTMGVISLLLIAYILSPVDLIPDVIPVIGWIDDLIAGIILLFTVVKTFI